MNLLLKYLRVGVGEEDDAPEVDVTEIEDAGTGDDALDDLLDAAEPKEDKTASELKAERAARERAEQDLRFEREARQRAEYRPPVDNTYQEEEARLAKLRADGADDFVINNTKWQIESNRTLRNSERNSAIALAQARDIEDRVEFGKLEVTNPKVYARYKDKIENEIQRARSQGQATAPRLMMLKYLLGEDYMKGKPEPKKARKESTVDRGRTVSARSDMGKKSGSTEQEKRRARLENQII